MMQLSKKYFLLFTLVCGLAPISQTAIAGDKKNKEGRHGKAIMRLVALGGVFTLLTAKPVHRVLGSVTGGVAHGRNLATFFSAALGIRALGFPELGNDFLKRIPFYYAGSAAILSPFTLNLIHRIPFGVGDVVSPRFLEERANMSSEGVASMITAGLLISGICNALVPYYEDFMDGCGEWIVSTRLGSKIFGDDKSDPDHK